MRPRIESASTTSVAAAPAPRAYRRYGTPPRVFPHGLAADNDATCDDKFCLNDAEAWARHAAAANGFGDAGAERWTPAGAMPNTPVDGGYVRAGSFDDRMGIAYASTYDMHRAARAERARILGDIVLAGIAAAAAFLQRAQARYRQRRREKAFQDALRGLSDHVLRDLGLDRVELNSIAFDQQGELE